MNVVYSLSYADSLGWCIQFRVPVKACKIENDHKVGELEERELVEERVIGRQRGTNGRGLDRKGKLDQEDMKGVITNSRTV